MLNDTVAGNNLFHDATVFQLDFNLEVVATVAITHAFLRELFFSDFDAALNTNGSLNFVLVPTNLQMLGRVALGQIDNAPTLRTNGFSIVVGSIIGNVVRAVRGIRMTLPKLMATNPTGPRHQFVPGVPQFDDIRLDITSAGNTEEMLDDWVSDVIQFGPGAKDGELDLRTANQTHLGGVALFGLLPKTFPPFRTDAFARVITLSVMRFELEN